MPWIHNKEMPPPSGDIADKDYYTDADGNVTDDPEKGAFHLIRAGQEIPRHMADEYGIGKVASAESVEEQPVKKSSKKRASTPSANKKASPPAKNKGAK